LNSNIPENILTTRIYKNNNTFLESDNYNTINSNNNNNENNNNYNSCDNSNDDIISSHNRTTIFTKIMDYHYNTDIKYNSNDII